MLVRGEPIAVHDLSGRMIHHLVPEVLVAPALVSLELLDCRLHRLPPIRHQNGLILESAKASGIPESPPSHGAALLRHLGHASTP